MRRRYEVELGDDAGGLVRSVTTPAPSAFLVKQAGVHTTDSWDWVRAADREFVRGSGDWITNPFVEGSQHATTRFVGVELDEVRAANTGLYEVTTTAGVPVRLHDMSLTRLAHDAAARTLVMEFLYDDPDWTPPEAEATPVAVFTFDDVEIVEQRDEPAEADTPPKALGQVQGFDYYEPSEIFALSAYTSYWVFSASVVTLRLRPANHA